MVSFQYYLNNYGIHFDLRLMLYKEAEEYFHNFQKIQRKKLPDGQFLSVAMNSFLLKMTVFKVDNN